LSEIRSVTSEYSAIYNDGSKDGDRVALAAVFGQQCLFSSIQKTVPTIKNVTVVSSKQIEYYFYHSFNYNSFN
jgi:hypothetical protein